MRIPFALRVTIVATVALVGITEVLSLGHLLVRPVVIAVWLIAVSLGALKTQWRLATRDAAATWGSLTAFEKATVVGIAFIAVVTLFLALVAAPSAHDAMSYHSARVSQWAQNHSVAHYPTHIDRQLWEPPLAEYLRLHLALIGGSDRLGNLPQWTAFVGCILMSYRVAGQLNASRTGRLVAALFAATLPMAIAQASGSQADLVGSFWIVASASLTFSAIASSAVSKRDALFIGASFGLAALSKGTAYFFLAPFAIWLGLKEIARRKHRAALPIVIAVMTALLVNAGLYARNYQLYGSVFGRVSGPPLENEIITPSSVASNVIRNLSTHAHSRSASLNADAEDAVRRLHRIVGADPDDPRTTYGPRKFQISVRPRDEESSGNPLQLALIFFSASFVVVFPRRRKHGQGMLLVCAAMGFLLFSAVLRWQPWNTRLDLPLFILCAGVVASTLDSLARPRVMQALALVLFLAAQGSLLRDANRPIVAASPIWKEPREQQYFAVFPELYSPHVKAARFLATKHCSNVGLITTWSDFEEWFWVVMRNRAKTPLSIRHVSVSKAEYPEPSYREKIPPEMCAVVTDILFPEERLATQVPPPGWKPAFQDSPLTIYLRE